MAACNLPRPGQHVTAGDPFPVAGWAAASSGIKRIEVRSEVLIAWIGWGSTHGEARPDEAADHLGQPDAARSGFSGSVPVTALTPDAH